MAVYTPLSAEELRAFLTAYDLGALIDFKGITDGVENTNYRVDAEAGRFILTLFEKRVDEQDLPYFLGLMGHMARAGINAPEPVAGRDGDVIRRLNDRPATIITFLPGRSLTEATPHNCEAVGSLVARMHAATADFPMHRANALSLGGWSKLAAACAEDADRCAPGLRDLIADELNALSASWPTDAPRGAIHADLYPDNIFFEGDALSGVIDFYFGCDDFFAYDLALTQNAWSWTPENAWREDFAAAMLAGYEAIRPLSQDEHAALPILRRGAALRILLTRLYDWLNQVAGAQVRVKDPLAYRDLLLHHRAEDC